MFVTRIEKGLNRYFQNKICFLPTLNDVRSTSLHFAEKTAQKSDKFENSYLLCTVLMEDGATLLLNTWFISNFKTAIQHTTQKLSFSFY